MSDISNLIPCATALTEENNLMNLAIKMNDLLAPRLCPLCGHVTNPNIRPEFTLGAVGGVRRAEGTALVAQDQ